MFLDCCQFIQYYGGTLNVYDRKQFTGFNRYCLVFINYIAEEDYFFFCIKNPKTWHEVNERFHGTEKELINFLKKEYNCYTGKIHRYNTSFGYELQGV